MERDVPTGDGYSAVLAEADAEIAANGAAIEHAVYAGVGLPDRFRQALGVTVALALVDATQGSDTVGKVAETFSDAVLLEGPSGARRLVPLAAVATVHGLPTGHRAAAGPVEGRRQGASLLRSAVGQQVQIALRGGRALGGVLQRVGLDHVQLRTASDTMLVAWNAVNWIALPQEEPGSDQAAPSSDRPGPVGRSRS